uniref:Uncharacterized protein n=1 Tax=Avena sativa TaxID=4498 RepID=A0ACD6APQ3_AVESA
MWLQIPPEYGKVIASAEGCLILASDGRCCEQKLRLLNPVTRAVAYLPDVPCGSEVYAAGFVYGGEDDADPTVVLCVAHHMKTIVYAKPGDTVWKIVRDEEDDGELEPYSIDGVSVGGRFYVPTSTGNVRELKLGQEPHLVYVAKQEARHRRPSYLGVTSSLAKYPDNNAYGGMVLLRFDGHLFEVFRVNFKDGKGSLTLVEELHRWQGEPYLDRVLLQWLTLGSNSSD